MSLSPDEALQRLIEGNQRFVTGIWAAPTRSSPELRQMLAADGQRPFAVILSCSDSRVPAEIIFDCGLGDLFIVRVAGNVVAPSLIGSIEFAALNLETALCVVVGHSRCGAVRASIDTVTTGQRPASDNIQTIVHEIAPAVRAVLQDQPSADRQLLWDEVVERNVVHSVESLLTRSPLLAQLVHEKKIRVVGAVYDLSNGVVSFLNADAEVPAL